MTTDEQFMRRCLQLAQNGRQNAAPNPMVGAVVVRNGRIIGEGYHIRCGEGHAEVNAIASVKHPEWLRESTIYVSLEPCAHYGKTPPCAQLIIDKQIPRVVVGCTDPFAKVAGRGIQMLRDAGIEVKVGVLEAECRALNRTFMTYHAQKRPYITLKWAQTADGYLDTIRTSAAEPALAISTPLTQMVVHKLRAEHQAILVGRRTAQLDNPSLTVRAWYGKQPTRIVLGAASKLPADSHLLDGSQSTLFFEQGETPLPQLMQTLHERGIQSLLVEGGAAILNSFLEANLWDAIQVECSDTVIGAGIPAPRLPQGHPVKVTKLFGHYIYNVGMH